MNIFFSPLYSSDIDQNGKIKRPDFTCLFFFSAYLLFVYIFSPSNRKDCWRRIFFSKKKKESNRHLVLSSLNIMDVSTMPFNIITLWNWAISHFTIALLLGANQWALWSRPIAWCLQFQMVFDFRDTIVLVQQLIHLCICKSCFESFAASLLPYILGNISLSLAVYPLLSLCASLFRQLKNLLKNSSLLTLITGLQIMMGAFWMIFQT